MKKSEQKHMSRVADLGCIVCRNFGYGRSPAEIHHIRDGQGMSQRASTYEVLPLCQKHHRQSGYGVSFHDGPEVWQRKFGTERALLDQVNQLLKEEEALWV